MPGAQILVVEDEHIIALDIQTRLKKLGYNVPVVASTGAGAIQKAEQNRPDLVLMDIHLKGDMNGTEAAEQIRTRFDIPVIYLTAYADETTLERAKVTEPFGYVLKPFEERELHTVIEMALYRHKLDERVRFERLKALGELAGGIAHNFNNLLVGMLGHAELIQLKTTDPEVIRETDDIVKNALRAKELVRRLNLSVGDQEYRVGPVGVNSVIRHVVDDTRPRWKDESEARGIRVDVVSRLAEAPSLQGTISGLYDILTNLLFNALDAMPRGGTITLSTAVAGGWVRLQVSDTGVGMDGETCRRVFDPLFTTKADVGAGLGLSLAHRMITGWGGDIGVESRPGKGTTFTIRLPVCDEPEVRKEADRGEAAEEVQVRRGSVLAVDDDPTVVRVLSAVLSGKHEVEGVLNGQEALETFEPGRYDVVLIDLGMPGIPGDRVAREMRDADPSVVTVLVTGWELEAGDPRLAPFDFTLLKLDDQVFRT